MITYTFLIGYGYVEDSRGTHAIVNFATDETNVERAVIEFLKTIRGRFDSNEEVRDFLRNYFDETADGLECDCEIDNLPQWNWWGDIVPGPLVRLDALNHLFDDPDEDNWHLKKCSFECLCNISIDKDKYENLDVDKIYEEVLVEYLEEDEEEYEPTEAERMFPDSLAMTYNILFWKNRFEIVMQSPNGMKFQLDKVFPKGTKVDIDAWIKSHIAKNSVKDNQLERD